MVTKVARSFGDCLSFCKWLRDNCEMVDTLEILENGQVCQLGS